MLSEDARTLCIALSGADAIAAVDTGTHVEKARYATGDEDWDSDIGSLSLAACAVSPLGDTAAGIDNSYGPDICLFEPGATAPTQVIDPEPDTGRSLRPHGPTWSPDGTRLSALTGEYGSTPALHVIKPWQQPDAPRPVRYRTRGIRVRG